MTESISASPGIEGGAGASAPVRAADAGAADRSWPVTGTPFKNRAEATFLVSAADTLLLISLFLIVLGGYHIHAMLTMGDWDFWIDWKDRRFWPTVLPIVLVTFPAAAIYYFWEHFRLPFGATFCVLGLLVGEWINRYVNFWGWTYFPISLVWPTALVPMALFLDLVMLISGSWIITMIVGAMGWGLLLYPSNWPILAPYHLPMEREGLVMSLADLIGYEYVRTSMPEYIRIVERGTMRTFGKDVVPVAAFFSGFVSILVFFMWWYVGKLFSTTKYMAKI
ncbi:bacterial ammonia monooxygenase, subunit AmoA [Methylocapsa palsarum]|uniref:bacterial ammonia monooxygenase, subunit AmoA n=1 Tax=Methylocapsa palsarum TaxID=1612308 RepID=UPI003CC7AB44